MKWRPFDTTEEIQAESQSAWHCNRKGLQEAFQKWSRLWDRCLYAGGNYFEGDGQNYLLKLEDKWITALLFRSLSHLFRPFILYLPFGDTFSRRA
jgi:hypothetical protein